MSGADGRESLTQSRGEAEAQRGLANTNPPNGIYRSFISMIKKKHEPNIWERAVIIRSILFPLMLLGCLVSCFYLTFGNSNTICFNTPFPSYSNLEQTAFFSFPTSARDIEFTTNALNRKGGCTIWVKFEMNASDFDTFKSSTLVEDFTNVRLEGSPFEHFSERMA
jgi:hypothetical protein